MCQFSSLVVMGPTPNDHIPNTVPSLRKGKLLFHIQQTHIIRAKVNHSNQLSLDKLNPKHCITLW